MKRILCSLFALCCIFGAVAQQEYPADWVQYTMGGYLCDIQSDFNRQGLSETDFKQQLLNVARANLAKTIKVQVNDYAAMQSIDVNGQSASIYKSTTTFSTDVEMNLMETRTHYNPTTREGFAIAYLHKATACRHYENEIQMGLRKVENALLTASTYINMGFKERAKTDLQNAMPEFNRVDELFFWVSLFGMPQAQVDELMAHRNAVELQAKQQLAELQHGTTICINCVAQLFDTEYYELDKRVRGILSEMGCNFTNSPSQSDWVIAISAFAREGQATTFGTRTSYFANAEAKVVIYKMATKQNIYENIISKKGGDTRNFTEAARAAYKELTAELGEILTTTIKQ